MEDLQRAEKRVDALLGPEEAVPFWGDFFWGRDIETTFVAILICGVKGPREVGSVPRLWRAQVLCLNQVQS